MRGSWKSWRRCWDETERKRVADIPPRYGCRHRIRSGQGKRLEGATVMVPYLRVANVQAGHLDLSEIKKIEVLESEVDKYRLLPGDILMTEGGDRDKLGRGTVWGGQISPCIHQNHVFRVRPTADRLLPEFLNYYMQTPPARGYFLRCVSSDTYFSRSTTLRIPDRSPIDGTGRRQLVFPIRTTVGLATVNRFRVRSPHRVKRRRALRGRNPTKE